MASRGPGVCSRPEARISRAIATAVGSHTPPHAMKPLQSSLIRPTDPRNFHVEDAHNAAKPSRVQPAITVRPGRAGLPPIPIHW